MLCSSDGVYKLTYPGYFLDLKCHMNFFLSLTRLVINIFFLGGRGGGNINYN